MQAKNESIMKSWSP